MVRIEEPLTLGCSTAWLPLALYRLREGAVSNGTVGV